MNKVFTLAKDVTYTFYSRKNKYAFTLAEVLITLGIIGIVAALTLPSLIVKHQKKVTAVRAKKAYSEFLQAIKLSEAKNGEYKNWDYYKPGSPVNTSKELMQKYIIPYFPGASFCNEGNDIKCGSTVSYAGQNYVLKNGTSISAVSHDGKEVYVIIDVNGKGKPNLIGVDAFYYILTEKGFLPNGWYDGINQDDMINGVRDEGYDVIYCKEAPAGVEGLEKEVYMYLCTAKLMMDGWEIKDNYPWVR